MTVKRIAITAAAATLITGAGVTDAHAYAPPTVECFRAPCPTLTVPPVVKHHHRPPHCTAGWHHSLSRSPVRVADRHCSPPWRR